MLAKTAEDHIRCLVSSETEATIHMGSPKVNKKKILKMLPGLTMSLNFSSNIQVVGSGLGTSNIKSWIHPAVYQQFRLVVR